MDNKPNKPKEHVPSTAKKPKYGRGYYAELLTKSDYVDSLKKSHLGATKKTSLLWQVKTEKYAPIQVELVPPKKCVVLAPAQRWTAFDADPDIVNYYL